MTISVVSELKRLCVCERNQGVWGMEDIFNGPFSGTTRVGRYQKGKTNLDLTEARDGE